MLTRTRVLGVKEMVNVLYRFSNVVCWRLPGMRITCIYVVYKNVYTDIRYMRLLCRCMDVSLSCDRRRLTRPCHNPEKKKDGEIFDDHTFKSV